MQEKLDEITQSSEEKFVLDYPNSNDFTDFMDYVTQDDAMAEMYLEEDEQCPQARKLFENNGKWLRENNDRCDLMLVLRENKKIIGFCELKLTKDSQNPVSQLFSVFVDKKYRGKGLANLMIFYALDFFVHSGRTDLAVYPTTDSLAVYNKFGFYPLDISNDKELVAWFKKEEAERLVDLKDSTSEHLIMDLNKAACQEVFKERCQKFLQSSFNYEVSHNLKQDLNTNVFDWRKKNTAALLSNDSLIVTNTKKDLKRKKVEIIENEEGPKKK
ncbi:Acetyltransferase (GNAT) family protein [Legionella nautarum]|uniref:Acetyltransferase (GNAT) family protein n=1 Tax=Legionella nautarum TaxID=45070 RepID=A0A0W0WU34_9GAMM|nr:GNAT family N-acetyltransferase [Legionella nautarum]KTD35854.1 Acetyltransferase (GNAT) family protein [Legionella nautarum]